MMSLSSDVSLSYSEMRTSGERFPAPRVIEVPGYFFLNAGDQIQPPILQAVCFDIGILVHLFFFH